MKGKKKTHKKWVILVVVLLLAVFLVFFAMRRKNISQNSIPETESRTLVCGVNEARPTHCVSGNGMLYGKNHSICYMDLTTKTEYVLCDEINCTHLTSKCSSHYSDDMNGLALYQGNVYLFDLNDDGSAFEFIRMDTAGNHRKALVKISVGNFDVGEWFLLSVSQVYYCGDYAWAELTYDYTKENGATQQQTQCIRISLETGEIAELTPLQDIGVTYSYGGISDQRVLLEKMWKDAEKKKTMYAHYACDAEKLDLSLLEEYEGIAVYNEDGTLKGCFPKYVFEGWYQDGFLFHEMNWELQNTENNADLWLWDTKNNVKTPVCMVEHGTAIMFGEGTIGNYVYDGENILFAIYKESGMIDIANVHLPTGEITPLFEDAMNVTFRIVGQTEDSFIGKIYDFERGTSTIIEVYEVKKEDYYQGNFDDMELLQTIHGLW